MLKLSLGVKEIVFELPPAKEKFSTLLYSLILRQHMPHLGIWLGHLCHPTCKWHFLKGAPGKRLCRKLSSKLWYTFHLWSPIVLWPFGRKYLWLMISPMGVTDKRRQSPCGWSPWGHFHKPATSTALEANYQFLSGLSWSLTSEYLTTEITPIQPWYSHFGVVELGLHSKHVLGRVQQACWPNGNSTSDILALYEKSSSSLFEGKCLKMGLPTNSSATRSNMHVPTGLLCQFHHSTHCGTPSPSQNLDNHLLEGTLLYFYWLLFCYQ